MSAGHILIVDDEPSMRRYLQTVLELDSYRVSTAANGEEALEKVQRDQPDVVLLDMVMPGADGLETLKRIRESRPTTKVVMLSCVRDTRKVAMAMRLGAQDYLSKPVQKEEMDDVLRFCLEHHRSRGARRRRSHRSSARGLLLCRHRADAPDSRPSHAGGALRFPGAAAGRERHRQGSPGAVDPQVFRPRPSHAS